ncbi:MAG: hypothetical protein LBG52_04290 [Candidatus Peribacteria bacterium]|jgi:hypothetical protein|nr:hypothetical protein [Candidatus Peribacteria bacterium]
MEKAIEDFENGKTEIKKQKEKPFTITEPIARKVRQLRVKRMNADKEGYVIEITTGQRVPRYETQGGHYISATYKSISLNLDNIHPQFP